MYPKQRTTTARDHSLRAGQRVNAERFGPGTIRFVGKVYVFVDLDGFERTQHGQAFHPSVLRTLSSEAPTNVRAAS